MTRLVTFYEATTGRVRFHATRVVMIQVQATAARIELRAIGTSYDPKPADLKTVLVHLRNRWIILDEHHKGSGARRA